MCEWECVLIRSVWAALSGLFIYGSALKRVRPRPRLLLLINRRYCQLSSIDRWHNRLHSWLMDAAGSALRLPPPFTAASDPLQILLEPRCRCGVAAASLRPLRRHRGSAVIEDLERLQYQSASNQSPLTNMKCVIFHRLHSNRGK